MFCVDPPTYFCITFTLILGLTDFYLHRPNDWLKSRENFSSMIFFGWLQTYLIQHLVLNRMNEQNSTPLGTSRLTDRHTQIIHSSQTLHAVQLCWVLTDTSQQQLYSEQNRENNNESDACWFVTTFGLCEATIAAHSGCSSILLPQLNSCPLIYIPNLATIKIPRLLVNSLSLSCSTSTPDLWTLPCDVDALSTHPNMCEENLGSIWWEHWEAVCQPRNGSSIRSN